MDTLIQLAHLSEEDLLSFSEKVAENLAVAFDSLSHEALEAKDRLKRYEEEQKRELNCLQGECSHLRSELDAVNTNLTTLREALAKEENRSLELTRERDNLNNKLVDNLSVTTELELVIKNLENDKESLNELLGKKMSECEQASAELREIQNEVQSARRLKSDALTQLEEVKTEKALLALREKRLEDTSESIKNQNLWLEEELHKANDKLLSFRRDNSERFLTLESELASRRTELENAQVTIAKLEDLVKQLTKSNDDHIEKLKLRTDELVNTEQLHTNELEAQRRLTDLYRDQASDVEKKYEEMQKAVTEMQEMLKQGHEHVSKLQSEKTIVVNALAAEKDKLMSENVALARELAAAKEIVDKFRIQGLSEDELRRLNPAVATTIASLKRGRSLTEIYSDYVQVVEERDLLKLDKERLTEHIREMMAQLEEKAPLLRSQQEAFYKSRDRVAELETQLGAALTNAKEKQDVAEDQRRRSSYFQRQNKLLKQSCKDLSIQVKTLLHELETARGTVITSTEEENIQVFPDSSTNDIDSRTLLNLCSADNSTAASVIDKNLVTFRSLSELQTQNARLLLVARDLASQLEDHESKKDLLASQVSEITAKVEVLSGEVDVARLAASEARSEANFAARQRDACMALLQRHAIPLPDFSVHNEQTPQKCVDSNTNPHDSAIVLAHLDRSASALDWTGGSAQMLHQSQTIVKLEESLLSLHAEFKQYREDKARSDEVYTGTIETLRRESTEARILNQKLAGQLDFTHEKFRTLESNVANYKQEISILREMNARYTTSAAASDEALIALREQSARTGDRLAAAEVECRQLIRQLEHTRANEARLSHELEIAQKTTLMHEHLMHQLQSIQINLEHREEMEARKATRHIEALEAKLEELKKGSEDRQQQLLSLNATLQTELSHTRQALRSAEEEVSQLRAAIAANKPSSPISNTGSSDLQTQASSSSANEQLTSADVTSGDGAQLMPTQLRNLEHECASLRVSLEAVRKQCAEYQHLGIEMETHIAKLTKEREHLEHTHATEIEDASQRCELLSLQLVLEKSERQDLIHEKTLLTEEYQASLKKLRDDLASVQLALRDAEERQEAALKLESSAHSEVAAHQKAAQEAREKYETELRLHAQDVQLLTEARKMADEARAEVEGLRVALETTKTSLGQSEEQLTAQTSLWEESRARLVKRVEDADAEINRLQEQILTLTEQIVNLRKLMDRSSDQSFSCEESGGQIKESEDFIHLLEYLRRQKSIAEAAEESANAEVSRLHLRTKTLEMQVADLEAKLAEERQRNEVQLETSSQHANIMQQIEQVNLLSESNRLLRQERQMIRDAAVRAEERLTALAREIDPLRTQCKELEDAREILALEKRSIAEERDRWKERCTRLVETSKRMDPEEYKQACNARDQLQATLKATEEVKAIVERESAARIAALEQQISELSSNLVQRESEGQSFTAKLASLEGQCKIQEDELAKRQVKITKLREIGRKYRQEADELKRQLSNTQEQEKSIKTTEEAIIAVRADLLNAQANLQIEQEQSSMLRQEMDHLQQLIDRVESLPDLDPIKHSPPESLIGSSLPTSSRASVTYNRLNHILSIMIAEFYRMRGQAEEQSERLLRMQLIESQLAKTKSQCDELKAQLASVMAAASTEAVSTVHSAATTLAEAVDQPISSPETKGNAAVTKSVTSTVATGGASWGLRAAATVQPVQTSPPSTASPSPLSSAARQTAEIRPLSNLVATVLPTTTAGAAVEPQASINGSSYLSPLNIQPTETATNVLGNVQTLDSQPLSTATMKPFVRYPSTVHSAVGPSSVAANDRADSCASSLPRCSLVTKRTYEEAILSDEQQISATAETGEDETAFPLATSASPDIKVSKRLKSAYFFASPATSSASVLSVPLVNPVPTPTTSLASSVITETRGAEVAEDEARVEETVEDGENVEEGREVEEEPVTEEALLVNFHALNEGEDTGVQSEREEQEDFGLVTEVSSDHHERTNRMRDGVEEEGEENVNTNEEEVEEENNAIQTDCEADEDDDNDDDEDAEAREVEDEDEEQDEGGTYTPVIILSSGEEVNEDEDGEEEVEIRDESNAEEEEEEEEDEDDVEEAEVEEEGDEDVRSGEEVEEVESQNEDTEGDEDNEGKSHEAEITECTRPSAVTSTSSRSASLFSQSGIEPPSTLFSSTMPPKTGGLFSDLKRLASTDSKSSSLFGGMAASAPRSTFASILTQQPQPGSSFIRQSIIPGPASVSTRLATPGGVGEMAPAPSKQKIRPIVWTESSNVSRKPSAPSSTSTFSPFGPPLGGVLGRRKNWGPIGGGAGRGAPRGSHR
ncbi:nucleoprotein TPR [Echinococcus multilocularis]|uniref:Nucleoprotein TPR n=1 Tax=Echinococcus multilocularis TaxID=6211 RepID=A0A087VYJ1_ECHMU|nr:nucleoprotein TPR [Echinococcus multilocularis]